MAITTPPEITPYPEAPQRNQAESVFVPLANTFVASLEPRRVEMQALADWMKTATDYIDGGVQAVADSVAGATQEAKDARDAAQLAESGAVSAKGGAETAQGLAEDARDASQLAETGAVAAEATVRATVGSYPDTTTGLAATTDGQYFALDSTGNVYLNNAGAAEQITDYASLADGIGMISAALDAINGEVV
ncbi:hypothetical protein [Marinobacter nauticus]|uniref:Uncharacterized protein n=1 Tax=Marinobacter nauticus TaxID=2743 RepID=A0A1M2V0X7_MARNT|nr:hypothetical protein [Marinobacter nauticus]OJT01238.1 hypothetical protein BEE62_14915 [Marinobacter nauticus]